MPKFKLNWNMQGFRGKLHAAGAVIEADIKEVEAYVAKEFGGLLHSKAAAVLSPVADDTPLSAPAVAPGSEMDLSQMTKPQLVAHADEYHDITIPATTAKPDMVALIEDARAKAVASAGVVAVQQDAGKTATADANSTQVSAAV